MEEQETNKVLLHKVVVFGQARTGKTTLIRKLVWNDAMEYSDPAFEDTYRKQMVIDGLCCLLDVIKVDSKEDRNEIDRNLIIEGEAFLLVYSSDSRSSFDQLSLFRDEITQIKNGTRPLVVVVMTKSDIKDQIQVTAEEGKLFAQSIDCPFFETSSARHINVEEPFAEAVRGIRREQGIICSTSSSSSSSSNSKRTCLIS